MCFIARHGDIGSDGESSSSVASTTISIRLYYLCITRFIVCVDCGWWRWMAGAFVAGADPSYWRERNAGHRARESSKDFDRILEMKMTLHHAILYYYHAHTLCRRERNWIARSTTHLFNINTSDPLCAHDCTNTVAHTLSLTKESTSCRSSYQPQIIIFYQAQTKVTTAF